jgi:general secretion pathway protein A
MYEAYYRFAQSPFTLAPDPGFLYLSASHDEAIRQILQAIRRKEAFIVLTGDIGTGKTTLCRALLERFDDTTFTSLILNPFLSADELLREILLDFGVVSRDSVRNGRAATATTHELASTLHDFLGTLAPLQAGGVLIIDEAQHLSPAVLEQIRILSNLEKNQSRLQVILVGQLNLLDVLAAADLRQLDQRISLRAVLRPLTREETHAYIPHRLTVARGASSVAFDAAAIDRVHAMTGGVPRVVNLLCDRSLMRGATANLSLITKDVIEEAASGLALEHIAARPWWRRSPLWAIVLAVVLLAAVGAALYFARDI